MYRILDIYDEIEITVVNLSAEPIDCAMLSADDYQRHFRSAADRRRHLAARCALRRVLGLSLGIPGYELDIRRDGFGRPFVAGIPRFSFSLTHCGDFAAVAHTRQLGVGFCVGVDFACAAAPPEADRIVQLFFSPHERRDYEALGSPDRCAIFPSLWACKEAVAKTVGGISALPFDRFTVALDSCDVRAEPPDTLRWTIARFCPGEGLAGAVAILLGDPDREVHFTGVPSRRAARGVAARSAEAGS